MKTTYDSLFLISIHSLAVAGLSVGLVGTALSQSPRVEIDGSDGQGSVVWRTEPGRKYQVEEGLSLDGLAPVPMSPMEADNLSESLDFTVDAPSKFFRVRPIDEDSPSVTEIFPRDEARGVGRFSGITVSLADESGIDPASIVLEVGTSGAMSLSSTPGLSWDGEALVFEHGGDVAWGDFGETMSASLTVADLAGNSLHYDWSFRLELEDVISADVFTFGSVQAQRSGQMVRSATVQVARTQPGTGPVKMDGPAEWELEAVNADSIVIAYTGATAPDFSVDQYVANATPADVSEIFYRKVTGQSDDTEAKKLTLSTIDVGLAEMVEQGSLTLDSSAMLFDEQVDGTLQPAVSFDFVYDLPALGQNADEAELYKDDNVRVWLPQANWSFEPRLEVSLDIERNGIQEFSAFAKGDFSAVIQPQIDASGSLEGEFSTATPLFKAKKYLFVGWIGAVPVWLDLGFELNASAGYLLEADATATMGISQEMDMGFGVIYRPGESPETEWVRYANVPEPEIVPFAYTINGHANIWAQLEPRIDVVVNSLAGVYGEVVPRLEIDGAFTLADDVVTDASWSTCLTGDLFVGVSLPIAPELEEEIPNLEFRLFEKCWGETYSVDEPGGIEIIRQPLGRTVEEGSNLLLEVLAEAPSAIRYQWFFNDELIRGESSSRLRIDDVGPTHTGEYYVQLQAGEAELSSQRVAVAVSQSRVAPGDVEDGLILHLRMDGDAKDSSGYRRHGSLSGTLEWQSGIRGQAVAMSEGKGWIEFDEKAALSPGAGPYAISAWVRFPERLTDRSQMTMFFGTNDAGPGYGGAIWCQFRSQSPGVPSFGLRSSAQPSQTVCYGEDRIDDGGWHHVVGVRRDTHTLEIWVDGDLVQKLENDNLGNVDFTATDQYGHFDQGLPVFLGHTPAYAGGTFEGLMDEVRVYKRALSSDEIRGLFLGRN